MFLWHYMSAAIATVLSQWLLVGLYLSQHLIFSIEFIFQDGRAQLLKAKHMGHTQQVCVERRPSEASTLARTLPYELLPSIIPLNNEQSVLLTFICIGNNRPWLHHEPPRGRAECTSFENHLTAISLTPPGTGSLPSASSPLGPSLWSLRSF